MRHSQNPNTTPVKMQLAMCFVLLVGSVLAGAFTSDGSSLELRSQHSLDSSLRSKAFGRALLSKASTCQTEGNVCQETSDCCPDLKCVNDIGGIAGACSREGTVHAVG
jgi:hypothetical protein